MMNIRGIAKVKAASNVDQRVRDRIVGVLRNQHIAHSVSASSSQGNEGTAHYDIYVNRKDLESVRLLIRKIQR